MKKEKNKAFILNVVISIISFLVLTIGATYSFYTALIIGNDKNGEIEIKTAEVYTMYEAENIIDDEEILPGWSNTMHFTISNTSKTDNAYGNYSLIWKIDKNEVEDENFVYTLTGETYLDNKLVKEDIDHNELITVSESRVPSISTVIGTGVINTGVTHRYELTITFKDNGEDQNSLSEKEFKSQLIAKGDPSI